MRRSPLVIAGTGVGLAGVLGLHIGAPAALLPTASAGPTTPRHAHGGATGGSAPPGGPSGATSTAAAATAPSGAGASGAPLVAIPRTAVGASEQYGYGALSVRVTVVGTRIQSIAVNQLQTADQYSQQLAQQVIPMLRSEVLSAQTAHINGISGASYTSAAYAYSVQSALDKLHVA